jgi:hypothetical protein
MLNMHRLTQFNRILAADYSVRFFSSTMFISASLFDPLTGAFPRNRSRMSIYLSLNPALKRTIPLRQL